MRRVGFLLMCRILSGKFLSIFIAVAFLGQTVAWSQGGGHEYKDGQIVAVGEEYDAIEFGEDFAGLEEVGNELPWIPVLSPAMFHLDCWLTKTFKIKDYYEQQAAEEYFAYSETCADPLLAPDPRVGTAFKYSLLAPVYAIRPGLLDKNFQAYGISSNQYGISCPMPGVCGNGPNGPQVLSGGYPPMEPTGIGYQSGVPMEAGLATSMAPVTAQPQVVQTSRWQSMSDADILAYFGLENKIDTKSLAMDEKLNQPVVATSDWEYADQSTSQSASALLAQMEPMLAERQSLPPRGDPVPVERVVVSETTTPAAPLPIIGEKQTFSPTDEEYGKMRDIEKTLLAE